jgi:hypothetical protein
MASEVGPTHSDRDPNSYRDGHPYGVGHPYSVSHCYLNTDVSGYGIPQAARQRKAIGVSCKKTSNSRHREESGNSEVNQPI